MQSNPTRESWVSVCVCVCGVCFHACARAASRIALTRSEHDGKHPRRGEWRQTAQGFLQPCMLIILLLLSLRGLIVALGVLLERLLSLLWISRRQLFDLLFELRDHR